MCTRAKHTLLLIDDESLYAGQKRRSGWSAGELLNLNNEDQRAVWNALPEIFTSTGNMPISKPETEAIPFTFPEIMKADVGRALYRATEIPRRVTPHALAVHASNEAEPEVRQDRDEN